MLLFFFQPKFCFESELNKSEMLPIYHEPLSVQRGNCSAWGGEFTAKRASISAVSSYPFFSGGLIPRECVQQIRT